eukprot:COSAG01_NODE_65328_length_273_cov_1.477011_2_plen_34_part_01
MIGGSTTCASNTTSYADSYTIDDMCVFCDIQVAA